MAKALNFTTLKKKFLPVTLIVPEKGQLTLLVTTPKKAVLDGFIAMKDSINTDDMDDTVLDDLYNICAKILSVNKAGIKISKEDVEEMFDYEDISIFIKAYSEFIHEVANEKNF